mmetsp:Transcript_37836/g.116915  ORF Transcript_37836/g.116915 Transcript_37836/m.116915 type:complete len:214 (-) Transcript_37836:467-1108(-)
MRFDEAPCEPHVLMFPRQAFMDATVRCEGQRAGQVLARSKGARNKDPETRESCQARPPRDAPARHEEEQNKERVGKLWTAREGEGQRNRQKGGMYRPARAGKGALAGTGRFGGVQMWVLGATVGRWTAKAQTKQSLRPDWGAASQHCRCCWRMPTSRLAVDRPSCEWMKRDNERKRGQGCVVVPKGTWPRWVNAEGGREKARTVVAGSTALCD